jgi:hypothetical protein
MTATAVRPPSLSGQGIEIVASLAQHRVLSTAQVRAVHLPDRTPRRTQQVLAALQEDGLVAHVELNEAPRRLWHPTGQGARLAREAGLVAEPVAGGGASALHAHTLAVNEAAICFLRAARERGDEFGPLSWRHEVVHPLPHGRGRRRSLIADAVLTYLRVEDEEVVVEQGFLELDRATLSVDRLAAELGRYARLHRARDKEGGPPWRALYPSFPSVVCVLDGAPRAALERRRDVALALLSGDPDLSRSPEVEVRVCLMEDLRGRGPFAPIFLGTGPHREPFDWIGRPKRGKGGAGRG